MQVNRLREIINTVQKAAQGDYSVRIDLEFEDSEFNDLGHAINLLIDNMQSTIARQKLVEQALKERERLLNNIIDQNPYSLWISDEKGTFLRGNQACYRLFNTREEELVDKYIIEKDNIIEKQGYLPLVRSVFEEGKTVQITLEYDTSQLTQIALERKTKVYIDVTLSPIRNEEGVITNAIIIHRNITDQVKTEESLRLSQFTIEHAANAIFWITRNGRFLFANEQACHSLGYTREELTDLYLWNIDPNYPKEKWDSLWNRFNKTDPMNPLQIKSVHRRKDGSLFPVEIMSQYLIYGETELHVAFVRDITERVKAEHDLHVMQSCIDHASIGVHRVHPDGHISMVNNCFCKNLGYTREELHRMTVFDIDPIIDRDKLIAIQQEIKERGSSVIETVHQRKDGTCFPVEITSTYFPYQGEEYLFSFAVDITDRKAVEESLRLFQYCIDYAAEAVFWMNRNGQYLYANHEACQSLGYTLDEIKRLFVWDIDPYCGKKNWYDEMDRHLHEGESYTGHTFGRHRRKDGTSFPVEVLGKHILFGDKQIFVALARDITERVNAERALRFTQFCIEHSRIGVHQIDIDGRITMVNEHFCNNLGYTRSELCQMRVFDIDPVVDWNRWLELRADIKKRGSSTFETVHRRKDGTCYPVEITANYFFQEDEAYYFCFEVDITERKNSEEALKTFQYSIDHAAEAVFWMNRDGGFIYVNQQACHSLGYTSDELCQLALWDIDPDFSKELWYAELDRHFREGESYTGHFSTMHRRKDGTIFPVEILAKHLFFGTKEIHVTFARDITDRVEAENALRDRERLLKESQEIAHLGHYRLNITTGVWECSDTLMRILGIDRLYLKDVQGWLDLILPEDRDVLQKYLFHTVIEEKQYFDREYRIVRSSSREIRWVHGLGRLEFDRDGNPAFMVGTIQDITDRKQEEAEKAKLESQLVQAQKMESVGRLAGGVAHDFNNMLCVILGYVELMKGYLPQGDRTLKNLLEIEKAAIRSRDITRQLLAFSRKQIISPLPMDINSHIRDMKKTLSRLIGEDILLQFYPGENLWPINFDGSQFDQILMNLAGNARDAMPGGGRLAIETTNVNLDDAYCHDRIECEPGSYVQLSVSDNGIGMSKETLENIFEPFFTTKELGKGTGLGLATVYGIVKQNGGSINVYSELGKGTTFKIYFPRLIDEDARVLATEEMQLVKGTETILLVEDDKMVRAMTHNMLESMGYTVLIAENTTKALSICERNDTPFDLLFTDVVMPDMSGTELRDKIGALRPGINVLFMSGYTTNVIVHHGVLEKGVHFIQKPFSMSDLSKKIREALKKA